MAVTSEEKRFLKKMGLKLRQIREGLGWTLEYTEERGYPGWRHLQEMESGKNVTIISLRRIAKVYRISLSEMFLDLD